MACLPAWYSMTYSLLMLEEYMYAGHQLRDRISIPERRQVTCLLEEQDTTAISSYTGPGDRGLSAERLPAERPIRESAGLYTVAIITISTYMYSIGPRKNNHDIDRLSVAITPMRAGQGERLLQ